MVFLVSKSTLKEDSSAQQHEQQCGRGNQAMNNTGIRPVILHISSESFQPGSWRKVGFF